jgi:hypothetical protein
MNDLGLIIWGTKDGTQLFFANQSADPKEKTRRDKKKDIRSEITMNARNINFYSI